MLIGVNHADTTDIRLKSEYYLFPESLSSLYAVERPMPICLAIAVAPVHEKLATASIVAHPLLKGVMAASPIP